MWQFLKLVVILALAISSEASPRRYHGLQYKRPSPRAILPANRLSGDVTPYDYKIELTVIEQNLIDTNGGTFSGKVAIQLNFRQELDSFKLHAKELEIDDTITLTLDEPHQTDFDGAEVHVADKDEENDIITISSTKKIPSGAVGTLTITYTGKLSDIDMDGFYRSYYFDDNGHKEYLATTQFEEMGARRAFPCFDEPELKATFQVTVTCSEGYKVLSNTDPDSQVTDDDGLTTFAFKKTDIMSTYLVAFIVSKFNCFPGDSTAGKNPVRTEVCARPGLNKTVQHALKVAPQALNVMENYTQISFGGMGLGKMSQAAIPDFAAGAMENWGMVTYREADLLFDENESSNSYKQGIATVISHEFSHQWFGDYITLDWWSDIFLNEGFATYFEYHATDVFQSDWQLTKQFVIQEVQPVLLTDSSPNSKALHYDTNDPDEISSRFDDISYSKGGTILRMVHHFLGLENFKSGLNDYLSHQRPVGYPDNLWSSFDSHAPTEGPAKPPVASIKTIMDSWTNKPGYPLLTVTLANDGKSVSITQKRFTLDNSNDATKWYVPITYITNKNTDASDTTTQIWLTPNEPAKIDLEDGVEWIILNKQQTGYYRVMYDKTLQQKISDALKADLSKIDEINRAQLVDDQFNFARAGLISYGDVLSFITFLKNDTSYYSWSSAFTGFNYLLRRTSNAQVKNALNQYIIQSMDSFLKKFPLGTPKVDQIDSLSQVLVQTWACRLDVQDCVSDVSGKFADLVASNKTINANYKSFAYCTGLRTSKSAAADYDFLYKRYTTTPLATEQITILRALGCVNDSGKRKEYLSKALSDDVRIQDISYVFSSVYTNSDEGIDDVVDFVQTNYKNFSRFGPDYASTVGSLLNNAASYITTQKQIDKLKALADSADVDSVIKEYASTAVKTATTNLDTISKMEQVFKNYFHLSGNGAETNSLYIVNLALISVVYLLFNH